MTRVFIVAPAPVMRAGLRMMLNNADIEVTGEATSLETMPDALTAVDCLVISAGTTSAKELAANLSGFSNLPVVVLGDDARIAAALQQLDLGGWAVLSPDAPAPALQAAVFAAAQGLVVLSPALTTEVFESHATDETQPWALDEPLTGREREVLELLSQGLSNKLIARRLQISEHTVKFHVSSLYTKLDASSRAEAVSRGARLGLITF